MDLFHHCALLTVTAEAAVATVRRGLGGLGHRRESLNDYIEEADVKKLGSSVAAPGGLNRCNSSLCFDTMNLSLF